MVKRLKLHGIITPTGHDFGNQTRTELLLAEVEEQQWRRHHGDGAPQSYESTDAFEESEGVFPASLNRGAEIVNLETAQQPFSWRALCSTRFGIWWRHNQLSGKRFIHVVLDGAFPFDLCLPESFGDLPAKDSVLAGTALMTASVLTPMSGGCGSGGGCACGSGGCGGH